MKKLLVSFYLIIPIISYSQNKKLIKPDVLYQNHFFYKIYDDMNSCIYIDRDTIQYNAYYKSKYNYLFKNNLKTDSIDINLSFNNPICFSNDKAWLYTTFYGRIYKLNENYQLKEIFRKDSFNLFGKYDNYFLGTGEKYTDWEEHQSIYKIDPIIGKIDRLINLTSSIHESSDILDITYISSIRALLIYTGYFDQGAMDQEQYFVFDLATKKLTEVTNQMQKLDLVDLAWYNLEHQLPDRSYDRFESSMFNNYLNGYLLTNEKILDQDFNIATPIVNRYIAVAGYNYENDRFKSFNLRTWLDDRSDAIIPYRFDIHFERALYKIYTNELLVKNDINQLDSYFYPLLKNFIYAKHNYQFEKEYYQAFFNLFQFYRTAKEKRSKKVEGKFTKADKANLKLILTKIK